ncbi:hypothetical protein KC614_00835 [candidate division WWE3 bacterium]|uniref:Uncharacterized protein n=1 Tax=candidate division WWE3 bacterium TaxID=2053526 RepID=A0A955RRP2_UNCKA|nr:hypothetical protein [candidate division WWE3 bacterium]
METLMEIVMRKREGTQFSFEGDSNVYQIGPGTNDARPFVVAVDSQGQPVGQPVGKSYRDKVRVVQ